MRPSRAKRLLHRQETLSRRHLSDLAARYGMPPPVIDPDEADTEDPAFKVRLGEAQNWRCCWCGTRMRPRGSNRPDCATFEHIIPLCVGGLHRLSNIAIACKGCNGARGINPVEIARLQVTLGIPVAPDFRERLSLHEPVTGVRPTE